MGKLKWIRKSELDRRLGRDLPIPTQVVSNEEFLPLLQTPKQRAFEHRIQGLSGVTAKKLGIDRRAFLRTAGGMATAFAAMNEVFGPFFTVHASELTEPGAIQETREEYFVFDVQTHHVTTDRYQIGDVSVLDFRRLGAQMNPALGERDPKPEDVYFENYIKEIFLDSETDVAVISGVPSLTSETNILPADQMVRSRDWINRIARSQRMVSHGLLAPDMGTENRERMQAQVEELKIDAWKAYTGLGLGSNPEGWWVDDEAVAYPALEYSQALGVKNVCIHKGLALGLFNEAHCHPRDIVKASKDFPEMNFLIYHSGFKALEEAVPVAEAEFRGNAYVPWVSDLCQWRKDNPHMTNVYMELGSTFALMVITHPMLCCHVLGMMIDAFGADHVLWGTDSIWWGSPQWQIDALRRLVMPESLMQRFGYAPLTTEVKRQIFGLNAARIYGVDPEAKRNPIPGDYIDQLRELNRQAGGSLPSNTQYGWILE
ncbi:MAG TPA: amidohydrolase family protein [Vicinamibacteria bacterium]|nr:amidohydrolase family protein [Vicinamibacteria bacterium]